MPDVTPTEVKLITVKGTPQNIQIPVFVVPIRLSDYSFGEYFNLYAPGFGPGVTAGYSGSILGSYVNNSNVSPLLSTNFTWGDTANGFRVSAGSVYVYYNAVMQHRVPLAGSYFDNRQQMSFPYLLEFADNAHLLQLGYTYSANTTQASLESLIDCTASSFGFIARSPAATYWYITGANQYQQIYVDAASEILSSVVVEDSDPYAGLDGESDIPGGGSIAIPGFPPATATATGIVGLFAPNEAQMQALASYMWTDFGGQGTDVVGVLQEIVEAIKRSISNPLDYVLGLNIIPSQGLTIGTSQVVRFGFFSSNVSMPRLSSQYFSVDCGTLRFDPLCGDTFLDYAPYSKFSIYLPYIGFRELDANDCVGHTIGVVYHGDAVTGGLTAYVTKDGDVLYQFSGSCALSIPLSADGWGSTISAAVQIATTIATAGAAAGAAGVAKAAAQGAASVAANPSLLSPQVAHSGAVSGSAGCMGIQYPYIIREAVRFHSTAHFNTLTGYPSFYYRELSEVSGYTRVLDVHLSNVPATQDEIAEIETLLKEGVEL